MLLYPTALLASQTILQGSRTDAAPQLTADNGVGIPHRQLDDTVCPAQTKHFTGSIGLDHGKELFYWLFSSASDPENDPLLVWLTGGPGGASTLAAVTEVGPCWVNTTDNSTYHNPYHWAQHANLLILDQPAGVGFSTASRGDKHRVRTLEAATEDFVDFLHSFVTKEFPKLSKNVLHIAGESYGGRWAPAFMHKLADLSDVQSARAIPNPLGSIILVNAVIGTLGGDLATSNYEFGCTPDGVATKLGLGFNSTVCSKIQEVGPQCEAYGALCESTDSIAVCKDASAFCGEQIGRIIPLQSRSGYNVALPCKNPEQLCVEGWPAASHFFNNVSVQSAMGIDNRIWSPIDLELELDFFETGAMTQSVIRQVQGLLDSGKVRVLVMNGDLDALVISAGQARIFDKLPWKGQLDYRQRAWKEWSLPGDDGRTSRGLMKNSSSLKFVRFEHAGHMVPGDDPRGASAVINEWILG